MATELKRSQLDPSSQWRARLSIASAGFLLFLSLSGLAIYTLPFSVFSQISVLTHTLAGLLTVTLLLCYVWRHWRVRGGGNLSHYQVIGYIAAGLLLLCSVTGLVVTWQGAVGPRMDPVWKLLHLATGLALPLVLAMHFATLVVRKVSRAEARLRLRSAQLAFAGGALLLAGACLIFSLVWSWSQTEPALQSAFPDDYDWTFGPDRPFAPSLARIDRGDGTDAERLLGAILEQLDAAQRPAYLAALQRSAGEAQQHQHYAGLQSGPFARHRQALASLEALPPGLLGALERIFTQAAARIRRQGALPPPALTGSERCGDCHQQILEEWLPSAHRYSSMDDLFQVVQTVMAKETSPAHTRYCAGCHDPISLFSGAKNSGNITLSAEGAHEGLSCIACHSISQADVQGNADFTITPPRRYLWEQDTGPAAVWLSDFLVRSYPGSHIESYSRPLYKTAEFCAACHKQYMDIDLNTNIGRVQGQNQYDSWARSRWHVEGELNATVNCRECHMPLVESSDPAAGDGHDYNRSPQDGRHRSHRFLGGNQYVPLLHDLPGAAQQVRLTEQWLRGELDIPEIAHKWRDGPVVRVAIEAPAQIRRGQNTSFRVVLTNNKTGHDFPTGPLDMIESWLEVTVYDSSGRVLHHSGGLDDDEQVIDTEVWFKADAFDRKGALIDRHNLWDLVGKRYSRSLYPGVTDRVEIPIECPSVTRRRQPATGQQVSAARASGKDDAAHGQAREISLDLAAQAAELPLDELRIEAVLWYRKANPDFLDRMYGEAARLRAPNTEMNRSEAIIRIVEDDPHGAE